MISARKEKFHTCQSCGFQFSNFDIQRICSNCFACTGCEIYVCPSCYAEVVIKPIKSMNKPASK